MFKDLKQTVVCASKYFNVLEIEKIFDLGITHFGENRAQDFLEKIEALTHLNLIWHFIGPLQTNKVKSMINHLDYLHTLDRLSLVKEIQKYRQKPLDCFIQINLTDEPQKNGVFINNLDVFLKDVKKYDKINIVGFMTMGKLNDLISTENAFKKLQILAKTYHVPFLSMGMSDDYDVAIRYGATHLRIGSLFKSYIT